MDIRQGKIRNINKKLIAGVLMFSIVSSTIVGCLISKNIELERQKYENFTGIASFDKLKECYFISLKDNVGNINSYIVERILIKESNAFVYLDLISKKNVFSTKGSNNFEIKTSQELVSEIKLEEYLYGFKMIENVYSDEDIINLLEQMKQLEHKKSK